MIAIKLPIQNEIEIADLQRVYTSCFRFAYNRYDAAHKSDTKIDQKQIRHIIKERNMFPEIGSWYQQCAILDAKAQHSATVELALPTPVFGGKRNFKDYVKGKITKEEFKENRLRPIQIQGEACKLGNRMFILDIIDNNCIIFKQNAKTKHIIELPKLKPNYRAQLFRLQELAHECKMPYMISLTKSHVTIAFDEAKLANETESAKLNENRILGIDMNPNSIGFSILEFDKNNEFIVLQKGLFDFKDLAKNYPKQNAQSRKRDFEITRSASKIAQIAKEYKCGSISTEDLDIKPDDQGKGKSLNKACNNDWKRNILIQALQKRCNMHNIKFVQVNAAYSSFVGNVQYGSTHCPDAIAASIEIARRGFKKYGKNWFYPRLKNVDTLAMLWKHDLEWNSLDWKELCRISKESEVKYRFPVVYSNTRKVFRLDSYKSYINLYTFA